HSPGSRRAYRFGPASRSVEGHQSGQLSGEVRRQETKVPVHLFRFRHDVFAAVFTGDRGQDERTGRRSQSSGDAVRALHFGRDTLQVYRRLPHLLVPEKESLTPSVSAGTKRFGVACCRSLGNPKRKRGDPNQGTKEPKNQATCLWHSRSD